jgi:hypothetical protein
MTNQFMSRWTWSSLFCWKLSMRCWKWCNFHSNTMNQLGNLGIRFLVAFF